MFNDVIKNLTAYIISDFVGIPKGSRHVGLVESNSLCCNDSLGTTRISIKRPLNFRQNPQSNNPQLVYSNSLHKFNMFSCVSSVFVLALPLFAAASVLPRDDPSNQCNTGPILCCDSVVAVSNLFFNSI
jgi:hypothetical protein